MNYFIEGLQGAGKSTLVGRLAKELPNCRVFREGDYNPVELAWCSYLTKEQYEAVLEKYAGIADEIKENTTLERVFAPESMLADRNVEDRYVVTYTRILTDIPGFHKDLEQYEIYNGRVDREGTPEEIFRGDYIRRLFDVEEKTYAAVYGEEGTQT